MALRLQYVQRALTSLKGRQLFFASTVAAKKPKVKPSPKKSKVTTPPKNWKLPQYDLAAQKESLLKGLNEKQLEAMLRVERGESLLLIGAAGTGKSHVTRLIKQVAQMDSKKAVACAPFGVAACNVGGFTIHSTFGIGAHDLATLSKLIPYSPSFLQLRERIAKRSFKKRKHLWDNIDMLIIDEISTCDSLTWEMIDYMAKVYRESEEPFGGIQVVCVGDFLQLPPVKGDWAFNAPSFRQLFDGENGTRKVVELLKVLRQSEDTDFLELLNIIRELDPDCSTVEQLYARQTLERTCNVVTHHTEIPRDSIRIVPLRRMAEIYNEQRMNELDKDTSQIYYAYDTALELDNALKELAGKSISSPSKQKKIEIEEMLTRLLDNSRIECELQLRKGARVMQLTNDGALRSKLSSGPNQVMNGHTGVIVDFTEPTGGQLTPEVDMFIRERKQENLSAVLPVVKWDHTGIRCIVFPRYSTAGDVWNSFCYVKKRLQLPLAPAWCITAHKCQGMTMQGNVSVSLKSSFAAGQCYVALSRGKSGKNTYIDGLSINTESMRGLFASKEALNYLRGVHAHMSI